MGRHSLGPSRLPGSGKKLPTGYLGWRAADRGWAHQEGAAAAAGVTAIRQLGRAAFPRLAYSWDGFLPLDVAYRRPDGHFTTVEFDPAAHEDLA